MWGLTVMFPDGVGVTGRRGPQTMVLVEMGYCKGVTAVFVEDVGYCRGVTVPSADGGGVTDCEAPQVMFLEDVGH